MFLDKDLEKVGYGVDPKLGLCKECEGLMKKRENFRIG